MAASEFSHAVCWGPDGICEQWTTVQVSILVLLLFLVPCRNSRNKISIELTEISVPTGPAENNDSSIGARLDRGAGGGPTFASHRGPSGFRWDTCCQTCKSALAAASRTIACLCREGPDARWLRRCRIIQCRFWHAHRRAVKGGAGQQYPVVLLQNGNVARAMSASRRSADAGFLGCVRAHLIRHVERYLDCGVVWDAFDSSTL